MASETPSVPPSDPLAKVCWFLNELGARYVVVGAQACILHGLVRTTEDVDILIEESDDNYRRIIDALSRLEDGAAAELVPDDFRENVVVKVADEVQVDVSRRAWTVDYKRAAPTALSVKIEGVRVPYASLEVLMESKQTYREQDRADLARLREIARRTAEGGE